MVGLYVTKPGPPSGGGYKTIKIKAYRLRVQIEKADGDDRKDRTPTDWSVGVRGF